jgi:hypothetical protein
VRIGGGKREVGAREEKEKKICRERGGRGDRRDRGRNYNRTGVNDAGD